jgi:hypothetical protein
MNILPKKWILSYSCWSIDVDDQFSIMEWEVTFAWMIHLSLGPLPYDWRRNNWTAYRTCRIWIFTSNLSGRLSINGCVHSRTRTVTPPPYPSSLLLQLPYYTDTATEPYSDNYGVFLALSCSIPLLWLFYVVGSDCLVEEELYCICT